jgi:hypothetical protein
MELQSPRPFSHRLQCMPTQPRRKDFFRQARLPGELGLAASPLLYSERQDYLAAIRAALSGGKGARVNCAGVSVSARWALRLARACRGDRRAQHAVR